MAVKTTTAAETITTTATNKWKMAVNDLAEDDMIDEAELVDDVVIPKPEECDPNATTTAGIFIFFFSFTSPS